MPSGHVMTPNLKCFYSVLGKWLRMRVKMCSGRFQEESEVASKCLAWQTLTYLNQV